MISFLKSKNRGGYENKFVFETKVVKYYAPLKIEITIRKIHEKYAPHPRLAFTIGGLRC